LYLPRIAFFSNRDIEVGEEITFNYRGSDYGFDSRGTDSQRERAGGRFNLRCRCEAPYCTGYIYGDPKGHSQ
jgi:SET domain-containing protein